MEASFKILGKPIGKGRPKFSTRGSYVQTYTPQKTVEYENLVRLAWMQSGNEKLSGAISAEITAYFRIPTSVSKKKRAAMLNGPYTKKPDADNICKSILDALNGIAFDDDSQVSHIKVIKLYSEDEYVEVTLKELGGQENEGQN